MPKLAWRKRPDGALVAERQGLDLTVCRPVERVARHEMVQFVVTARDKATPNAIIGSGLAEGMTQAMRLAEGMAGRFGREPRGGRSQILVVDDDTSLRKTLADVLRDHDYEVVEASSAEGALRRLERIHHPVVLVSDVNLGHGMSGLELAAEVRELWPAVSILLMSGSDEGLLADDTATIAFLAKPMSTDRLLGQLATMFAAMQPTQAGH